MEITLASKTQYATDLKFRLSKCRREVYKLLINEHRNMHRGYINARWPDPFLYEVGDHVWTRRQIKPNKAKGIEGILHLQ